MIDGFEWSGRTCGENLLMDLSDTLLPERFR